MDTIRTVGNIDETSRMKKLESKNGIEQLYIENKLKQHLQVVEMQLEKQNSLYGSKERFDNNSTKSDQTSGSNSSSKKLPSGNNSEVSLSKHSRELSKVPKENSFMTEENSKNDEKYNNDYERPNDKLHSSTNNSFKSVNEYTTVYDTKDPSIQIV